MGGLNLLAWNRSENAGLTFSEEQNREITSSFTHIPAPTGRGSMDAFPPNCLALVFLKDLQDTRFLGSNTAAAATATAKSLQSCPTLCDPTDGSPPGSPVPGVLQTRTLEWVAISFSNAWKWKMKMKSLSRVRLFMTPWTAADQAPLSMGFSRQEYWSGVPLPSPG